jgi:hypothetical protein
VVAGGAALLLVLLLVVDGTRWVELRITDSLLLVRGSHAAAHCLGHGPWTNCTMPAPAGPETVGAWPLAQYLFTVPLVAAGVADLDVLTIMAVVSALACGGMLLLVAFPLRRLLGREWAVILGVMLLTGPFLLYAFLPFGEALAAFLALAFVVAACARRPWLLFATALLACITKETAAPFLVLLGIVCAREAADRWFPARHFVVAIVGGAALGVAANSMFNLFRFGDVTNLEYGEASSHTPGVVIPAKLAASNWFAPNVGVLWFWFLATLLIAGLLVATVVLVLRAPRDLATWLPPAVVLGVGVVFTAGLSKWYSTFGWVAWGPRLTLPMVPALVVAGIHSARAPMTAGLRWVARRLGVLFAVAGVTAVLAVAQAGVVWNGSAIQLPLVLDTPCPKLLPVDQASPDYFFGCGIHEAWRLDPLSLWESSQGGPATQQVAQGLAMVMVLAAAGWLHLTVGPAPGCRKRSLAPAGGKPVPS